MASLLVAASYLTYNKIKDKRAAKKEVKRQAYETRYNELEREHCENQEKRLQAQRTGSSQGTDQIAHTAAAGGPQSQPQDVDVFAERRKSSDSERASTDAARDDPSSWVDDVLRERAQRVRCGAGGTL